MSWPALDVEMKKTRKTVFVSIVAGLLLMAMAAWIWRVWVVPGCALPVYTYESSDRGMAEVEVPWKGRDLKMVEAAFDEYKKRKGDPSISLRRTCARPWGWSASNLWWDNLTNRRWRYPYMTPSEKPAADYFLQTTAEKNDRKDDTPALH